METTYKYARERYLYNIAFGKFIARHKFEPEGYLEGHNLVEYNKLRREDNEI